MRIRLLLPVLLLATLSARAEPWALVDTGAQTLTVFSTSGVALLTVDHVAIGSGGVSDVHYRGDNTTPRGNYRIRAIRKSHRFVTFYELDYPQTAQAEQAFRDGRLSAATRDLIAQQNDAGHRAVQRSILGGWIGIHGVGMGNPDIHRSFNWTDGCVALDNDALAAFGEWADVGMRVEIR
ncbi:L,D-transpeptidase [Jeongeupia wiesaeckerbachi]|uniref:L,D-transpeptidase family protein n=1 Tax=Jeongeupia wiesaeckerbachi TaxID=3051218 RepID=UPI003D8079B2